MSVRGCNEDNAVRHKQLKEPETSMSKLNGLKGNKSDIPP
jgi:hypothetical protein